MYVVIFGQLAVYAHTDGKGPQPSDPLTSLFMKHNVGKLLGTLVQGDHFGEMSVLANIPRQATVRTVTSCLLISISRAHFRNLMKIVPDVGESVQTVMRLYMLSKFFRSLMYSEVLTKLVRPALFELAPLHN